MLQMRTTPSTREELVLMVKGQNGQGFSSFLNIGGIGMISKLVTDFAPCLLEVPTQSEPVSPPPITMTFLPWACKSAVVCAVPSTTWLFLFKNSIACTTPFASPPGIGRPLLLVAPPQSTTASKLCRSSAL